MSAEAPDPQIAAFEATLARLSPSTGALNRDQLLFRAGQTSATQRRWLWPCATAAALLLAAGLGAALLARPEPQRVERLVIVREPAPVARTVQEDHRPPISADYLLLREQVLRRASTRYRTRRLRWRRSRSHPMTSTCVGYPATNAGPRL